MLISQVRIKEFEAIADPNKIVSPIQQIKRDCEEQIMALTRELDGAREAVERAIIDRTRVEMLYKQCQEDAADQKIELGNIIADLRNKDWEFFFWCPEISNFNPQIKYFIKT